MNSSFIRINTQTRDRLRKHCQKTGKIMGTVASLAIEEYLHLSRVAPSITITRLPVRPKK